MSVRPNAGFTLLEALIIMVIVGIVSAAAYPLARNAVVRSDVHGARSHAVTLFGLARATAQETGRAQSQRLENARGRARRM